MPKVKKPQTDARERLPWLARLLEEIEQAREREHVQPSLPFSPMPDSAPRGQSDRPLGKRHAQAAATALNKASPHK